MVCRGHRASRSASAGRKSYAETNRVEKQEEEEVFRQCEIETLFEPSVERAAVELRESFPGHYREQNPSNLKPGHATG